MYIGGGGEEGSGLSAPNVSSYAQDRGNFAAWTQDNRIQDYIEIARALRQPVVLIGHSWGGDAAFDAARYADRRGIDVNLLVTIDPVDSSHDHTRQEAITLNRNLGGLWVNVQATRYLAEPNFSDRVAGWGGRMSDGAQAQADIYVRRDVHHEDFVAMLREAQVEQLVAGTYANIRPR
jgi:thioesterase domain-containing protein